MNAEVKFSLQMNNLSRYRPQGGGVNSVHPTLLRGGNAGLLLASKQQKWGRHR